VAGFVAVDFSRYHASDSTRPEGLARFSSTKSVPASTVTGPEPSTIEGDVPSSSKEIGPFKVEKAG
jgi:hypothetical protein